MITDADKSKMLIQLEATCRACVMCELGGQLACRTGHDPRNPHVLSNLVVSRFMVIGQNPGWNELEKRTPFVGQAGGNFDTEIAKHDLSRDDFYICNSVRCFTEANTRPERRHIERCRPFLQIEINLLKPLLVVALGAVAFESLCPGVDFSDNLKSIVRSKLFDVPVFPIYHPSPLNLNGGGRLPAFQEQIALLCGLVKRLRSKGPA